MENIHNLHMKLYVISFDYDVDDDDEAGRRRRHTNVIFYMRLCVCVGFTTHCG